MTYQDNELLNDTNSQSEQQQNKPGAYRVDDETGVEESDLKRSTLFGSGDMKPVREGQPMGGENFGANSVTPSGDDKNNPSQNAGYSNAYFRRTEPAEEHTESNNFKPQDQEGRSDYDSAQPSAATGGEGDAPQQQQTYQEGTDDNDGESNAKPNIPGPNEVPDQQKVGEDVADDKSHTET